MRLMAPRFAVLLLLITPACAQVPKESVELSATVGRDIAEVYRAHRELAQVFYGRMKGDINEFVDDVYAPYQINRLIQFDRDAFQGGDKENIFGALETATKNPGNPQAQKDLLGAMEVFVQVVHAEVESYRADLLAPVETQESDLLSAIDRSYNQIHYANSIVTGHLASIVKVHDAQEELLKEFGLEGLRKNVGTKLAATSKTVAKIVGKAEKVEGTVAEMDGKIKDWTDKLKALFGKGSPD